MLLQAHLCEQVRRVRYEYSTQEGIPGVDCIAGCPFHRGICIQVLRGLHTRTASHDLLPGYSRPGFIALNVFLVCLGLFCYAYWVRPAKTQARVAIWFWIVIESYNAIAHTVWVIAGAGYNPGLISAILFFPLAGYLAYGMRHTMIVVGNRP